MTAGFITGALLGGLLLGVIPNLVLIRTLALLLGYRMQGVRRRVGAA
jgi:hypothetical protein